MYAFPLDENPRKIVIWRAFSLIDTPYIWGGNDPMQGFDCSGLGHEVLQTAGLEERGFDSTAHDIYLYYLSQNRIKEIEDRLPGDLVFWLKDSIATHMAILVSRNFIVHAGSGGSDIKTIQDAIDKNAYVRPDKLNYPGQNYRIIDPY